MLALGLGGMLLGLPRGQRLCGWSVLLAPVLACTLFAPVASARGYIVYGGSAILFATAGNWLATAMSQGRGLRSVALATLLAAALGECLWSVGIAQGMDGPAVCYFLGWDDGGPLIRQGEVRILPLADHTGDPDSFAIRTPATTAPTRRSRVLAHLSRGCFVFGIALLVATGTASRCWRRRSLAVWLSACVGITEAGLLTACPIPSYWDISTGLTLAAGEAVTLRVDVQANTSQALFGLRSGGEELSLFVPAHGECEVEWRIDGQLIPLQPRSRYETVCHWQDLPAIANVRGLWEFTLRNPGPTSLAISGWQRPDASGKSLTQLLASCVPAVEVRVRAQHTGTLLRLAY